MMEQHLKKIENDISAMGEEIPANRLRVYSAFKVNYWDTMRKLYELHGRGVTSGNGPVIAIPSLTNIDSELQDWHNLLDFSLTINTNITVPVALFTYHYVFNENPKRTVKVQQFLQITKRYFKYIKKEGRSYTIETSVPVTVAKPRPIKVASVSKKTSLGHKSFGSRLARLQAEAKDPPGYILMTKHKFPSFTDYKYMSSVFTLQTPSTKGKEKCKLILFKDNNHKKKFTVPTNIKAYSVNAYL